MNGYQKAKAKKIAALLLDCAKQSGTSRFQTAKLVSLMSEDQWRTVALTAGVPVADIPAKLLVLSELRGKSLHAL